MRLNAVVLSHDGTVRVQAEGEGPVFVGSHPHEGIDRARAAAIELGRRVADDLIGQGARELIRAARLEAEP